MKSFDQVLNPALRRSYQNRCEVLFFLKGESHASQIWRTLRQSYTISTLSKTPRMSAEYRGSCYSPHKTIKAQSQFDSLSKHSVKLTIMSGLYVFLSLCCMLQNGDTPLHCASRHGDMETVRLLLAKDSDVHGKNKVKKCTHVKMITGTMSQYATC